MLIYKATNKLNQKSYIGKTERSLGVRLTEHIRDSKKENITSYFHRALKKYGIDNFEFTIIAETNSPEELNCLEIEFISKFETLKPNGYNITSGGTGGNTYKNLDREFLEQTVNKSVSTRKENYKRDPLKQIRRSEISNAFWDSIRQDDVRFTEYSHKISSGLKNAWKDKVLTDDNRLTYSIGQKRRFAAETELEKQERKQKFKEASGTAKEWKLTFPDGNIVIIRSIFDYCKEHNLPYNIIYGCHRTKKPSKHGWNLEET